MIRVEAEQQVRAYVEELGRAGRPWVTFADGNGCFQDPGLIVLVAAMFPDQLCAFLNNLLGLDRFAADEQILPRSAVECAL